MPQITGFPRSTDTAALGSTPQIVISGVNPSSGVAAPFFLNSAANLSQITQPQGLVVAWPGQWVVFNAPASGVKAAITKAAGGAGVRHVCTGIIAACVSTVATGFAATVVLSDGAANLITFYQGLEAVVDAQSLVFLSGLSLIGSPNTAMTLTYANAFASVFESVTLIGYDVV